MKNSLIVLTLIMVASFVFGQNPNTREFNLTIAFNTDLELSISSPEERLKVLIPEFSTLQEQYNFELRYAFVFSEDDLERMENEALRVSGNSQSIANLRNVFTIQNDALSDTEIKSLQKEFSQIQQVRYAELVNNKPIKPPFDIPPTTPDYVSSQTYLNPNPGVDMKYAWNKGVTGQGIRIRNVEYGFNKNHEEFHENERIFLIPGYTVSTDLTSDYTEHGTGTFGVLFGDNGDYGITGMVHGAEEAILFPEFSPELNYSRTEAVSLSINNSQEGDFIIYEMQTGGFESDYDNPKYVAAEYSYPIWDLTKAASDMGIIVVAAAGNGDENLDDPGYLDYMQRGNSGAIIVGAGSPTTSHNKLVFSTYGSRVNLHGWGSNVLSAGYGDYAMIGDDFNQQYTKFSGTSSATPIVASAAIAVQSYYHFVTGEYMNSAALINLLQTTGIPQGTGGNIGPLPNVRAAIETLDAQFANIDSFQKYQLSTYPNPFKDVFYINGINPQGNEIQLYDILGKTVDFSFNKEENAFHLHNVNSGVYFLTIQSKEGNATIKLIKE